MYVYAYDAALQDKRYERELDLVETRLTDLGITGNVVRLGMFRDPVEVLRAEVRKGAKTLVAVGGEETFQKAIEAAAETKTVVGYIPLLGKSPMADLLGIPSGAPACDVLSARLVDDMDLGEVNGRRFLHIATFDLTGCVMRCEDRYSLTPLKKASLEIRNLTWPDEVVTAHPADGKLTYIIRVPRFSLLSRKKDDISLLSLRHVRIFCPNVRTMMLGNDKVSAQEFDLRVLPGRLRLVCGKDRKYVS